MVADHVQHAVGGAAEVVGRRRELEVDVAGLLATGGTRQGTEGRRCSRLAAWQVLAEPTSGTARITGLWGCLGRCGRRRGTGLGPVFCRCRLDGLRRGAALVA